MQLQNVANLVTQDIMLGQACGFHCRLHLVHTRIFQKRLVGWSRCKTNLYIYKQVHGRWHSALVRDSNTTKLA